MGDLFMNTRDLAIYFAGLSHKEQMYGESPYIFHLMAVDQVLADEGYTPDGVHRIASILHDTMEDCDVTRVGLEKVFGSLVAECVWRVSNEPGENRREKASRTYPKIAGDRYALPVKLADRIANMEHSAKTYSRFGLMYVKEHPAFKSALYDRDAGATFGPLQALWHRYFEAVKRIEVTFGAAV